MLPLTWGALIPFVFATFWGSLDTLFHVSSCTFVAALMCSMSSMFTFMVILTRKENQKWVACQTRAAWRRTCHRVLRICLSADGTQQQHLQFVIHLVKDLQNSFRKWQNYRISMFRVSRNMLKEINANMFSTVKHLKFKHSLCILIMLYYIYDAGHTCVQLIVLLCCKRL